MEQHQSLIVLVGPTACGKTSLSIKIAQHFDAEIISGDSMQVYRGMDIGTAKITQLEQDGIPHHMIDILSPLESFNVADFRIRSESLMKEIHNRNHIPMVVGGTGLYIDALLYPYSFPEETGCCPEIRRRLQAEYQEKGGAVLHRRLSILDPESATRIHPNDAHRLIRALEVIEQTGQPLRPMRQGKAERSLRPKTAILGLTMDRNLLYQRIEQRVDQMLDNGLVNEVQGLLNQGIPPEANSMQGIGYRQIVAYLNGELKLDEAIDLVKRDTRRFAKRQMTWFKRNQEIHWFDVGHYRVEGKLLDDAIAYIAGRLKEV